MPKLDTKEPTAQKLDTKETTIPKLDSKEPNTAKAETEVPKLDTKEPITFRVKTEEPNTSKIDTKEPYTAKIETEMPKLDTKEPLTSKVETGEPKLDTKEPIHSTVKTEEPKTSKIDTKEPTTSKEDTQEPTDSKSDTKESITSKVETKEPITSKIENTDKPSSEKEYNTQNTPEAEKTDNISPKTSIVDNKEQTTNIPSIKDNTEQPTNSQIGENTAKTTSHATNENIDQTTKPSIDKEPEHIATPSDREEIKQTTSSPDEETPITNKNIVHTNIPTSLNLTSLSTNLVENPRTTSIAQSTEVVNTQEESVVIIVGISHFNFVEQIIRFFIYFSLSQLLAGSKRVKFPVELSTRRVLRGLQTQDAECDLVDEGKGDLYAYLCEVQTTSNQTVKGVKIINKYEFSSVNYSVTGSASPLIEGYLDNIQEIGNKLDFLLNSTLYTLENSKIELGEKQIFNISGIINDPKPKFEKVDLNLSVSAQYGNSTEEKQLDCSIIDIIENNYTLNCIGIKNTNLSLKNAMSIIGNETLIIRFGANENSTILYYTDETKNGYSVRFFNNKGGSIGAGGVVAIVLACLAAVAALIISFMCFRKASQLESTQESTTMQLKA